MSTEPNPYGVPGPDGQHDATAALPGYPPPPTGSTPSQPYAPGQFPPPVNAYAQPWAVARPYDGLAIAAISTGVASLVLGVFFGVLLIGAPVALVLGIVSLGRIKKTGAQGRALAITGIVTGGLGILGGLAWLALVVFFVASFGGY
ncbi:DUF4190 domain-containing protein [Cellulomonas sp. NPDC089187]|uniref:DUF4190 domain-containing protein n=1 Tax=Cellulomonas sp. NPDC089187 TaxID=3154970 RepID=UPI00341C0422